ncbi:hypothetical protein GCM10023195_12910 [Actinoallomurus liliacearum]|uniref:Uncharacterized protein n=1 Tax=Actinoallomurus liliacearum TaxID=1080073 RepID=A0ABP8TC33_9ACTN
MSTITTNAAPAAAAPAPAVPVDFDPADFIAELRDEGQFPITAGGDPAVPDSLGSDPVRWAGEYMGHAKRKLGIPDFPAE